MTSLAGKGLAVPHWKALSCGIYDSRELSCGSILNIFGGPGPWKQVDHLVRRPKTPKRVGALQV